jgi:hypothetical protein
MKDGSCGFFNKAKAKQATVAAAAASKQAHI